MSLQSINELNKNGLENRYQKPHNETIRYTITIHSVRKKLDLTMNEYAIADYIERLGNAPQSRSIGGWVFATKETIAKNLGFSRITIIRGIKALVEKDIVERGKNNLLQTTAKWYNNVVLEKEKIIKST